jgi:hypothetical protein
VSTHHKLSEFIGLISVWTHLGEPVVRREGRMKPLRHTEALKRMKGVRSSRRKGTSKIEREVLVLKY